MDSSDFPPPVDYTTEHTHHSRDIWLPELSRVNGTVLEHKFVRCRIVGPTVVHLSDDTTFAGRNIALAASEWSFWPTPEAGFRVGIIGMIACWFDNCVFDGIAFVVNNEEETRLRELIEFSPTP
jgi:hypothetical protein